ncbi:MAG: hypothetical protein WDN24_20220 [Sphingomonas sp.]
MADGVEDLALGGEIVLLGVDRAAHPVEQISAVIVVWLHTDVEMPAVELAIAGILGEPDALQGPLDLGAPEMPGVDCLSAPTCNHQHDEEGLARLGCAQRVRQLDARDEGRSARGLDLHQCFDARRLAVRRFREITAQRILDEEIPAEFVLLGRVADDTGLRAQRGEMVLGEIGQTLDHDARITMWTGLVNSHFLFLRRLPPPHSGDERGGAEQELCEGGEGGGIEERHD